MKLDLDEVELITKFREARELSSNNAGVDATVNIFVGTPENCLSIMSTIEALESYQKQDAHMRVKTLVFPLSTNPIEASAIREHTVSLIDNAFEEVYPDAYELN